MTQDGVELLLDQIGDSRKFEVSLEELLLFVDGDNGLVWDKLDLEKLTGLAKIKTSEKLGYVAIFVKDESNFF